MNQQQQQQQRFKRSPQIDIHGTHNGNLTYIDILDKRRHENVNVPSFPGWDAFGRSGNNVFSFKPMGQNICPSLIFWLDSYEFYWKKIADWH